MGAKVLAGPSITLEGLWDVVASIIGQVGICYMGFACLSDGPTWVSLGLAGLCNGLVAVNWSLEWIR